MDSLEGYLRPGCVHLTAQALLTNFAAARLGQPPAEQQQAQQAPQAQQAQTQSQQAQPQAQQPAAEGSHGAQQRPPCCRTKVEEAAAEPAAAPAAASPSEPATTSPAGCCGRKRAAEAPAQPVGVPTAAVRRIVHQMLASGGIACWTRCHMWQPGQQCSFGLLFKHALHPGGCVYLLACSCC